MILKLYIIIKSHINFCLQILRLYLGWVFTTLNKRCMRERAISLKELAKFKLKNSNGDLWSLLVIEEWDRIRRL